MYEILKPLALKNIWCEPTQDRQYIFAPPRLTGAGGAFKHLLVGWDSIPLPNADMFNDRGYYHVYQIGRWSPALLNLDLTIGQWTAIDALCQSNSMIIDVFLANGAKLPRYESWFWLNADGNILLAVRVMPSYNLGTEVYTDPVTEVAALRTCSLDVSTLYIRLYSNTLFNTLAWRGTAFNLNNPIVMLNQTINQQSDYLTFMSNCNAVETAYGSNGASVYQQDGFVVNKPTVFLSSMIGTTLSFTWDESVKEISFFNLALTPTFLSTLDENKSKYALIRSSNHSEVDYFADVDFYLVDVLGPTYKGIYIGRLDPTFIRQITHNAYSVLQNLITALKANNAFLTNSVNLQIMAVVRQGGMDTSVVSNTNCERALYQLPYADVVKAMTVLPTTVPEWSAANLENSAYIKLMGVPLNQVTDTLCEQALGYDGSTQLAAKPIAPVYISGDTYYCEVSPVMMMPDLNTSTGRRSVFCYNAGSMVGYFQDSGLYNWIPIPSGIGTVDYTESFNYTLSTTRDGVFYSDENPSTQTIGTTTYDLNILANSDLAQYGFRCYACGIAGGVPNEVWHDITGTDYYTYDPVGNSGNGFTPNISWNNEKLTANNLYGCVKINNQMLVTAFTLAGTYNGYISLTAESTVNWRGSPNVVRPQKLSPGVIDVFMEGRSLIRDLDYYVNWPTIVIVKRPVSQTLANVNIVVRTYGFCDPATMSDYRPREQGFVKGGMLSVDGKYDFRNDRNIRIAVGGAMRDRSQVNFAEQNTGTLSVEGRPYSISDYQLPVEGYTNQRTMDWWIAEEDLENRVVAYLSQYLSDTPVNLPAVEQHRWGVFSPFCSAVIAAILNGSISSGDISGGGFVKSTVDGWLASYMWLLAYDPCIIGVDSNYVVVYPHQYRNSISLTTAQYSFLLFVVANYLNNSLSLAPSITIEM